MAYDGSSEKDIRAAFEKLSITSSDQTSFQTSYENPSPLQNQILSRIDKNRKCKNRADAEAIAKKINNTSNKSFDEGYITFSISQLLDKKITGNIKTPQHLDSFHMSTTENFSKYNLSLQMEEILLDDTEQCQQNTHCL